MVSVGFRVRDRQIRVTDRVTNAIRVTIRGYRRSQGHNIRFTIGVTAVGRATITVTGVIRAIHGVALTVAVVIRVVDRAS